VRNTKIIDFDVLHAKTAAKFRRYNAGTLFSNKKDAHSVTQGIDLK